jgi:hypothetical protein
MGSVLEFVDCDRCDKKSVDWAQVYIHKSEQEHRPHEPRVTPPSVDSRVRLSGVVASLAYKNMVIALLQKSNPKSITFGLVLSIEVRRERRRLEHVL